jgi:hypothetical protein
VALFCTEPPFRSSRVTIFRQFRSIRAHLAWRDLLKIRKSRISGSGVLPNGFTWRG